MSDRHRDASIEEQLGAAEQRLDRLLDWVGRSDTKFSVVLGVDTAMLGFLATSAPAGPVSVSAIVFALAAGALLVLSLTCVYRGTYPRTQGPGGSLVYFGSIAEKDLKEFENKFVGCDLQDHLDDVLEQIHRNSEILNGKFEKLQRAYECMLIAAIPWTITLYLFGLVPPPA